MVRSIRSLASTAFAATLLAIPLRAETQLQDLLFTVESALPGATLEATVGGIAKPLEDELGGLPGVEAVISISRPAKSILTVKFRTARAPDDVLDDLRKGLERSRNRLPPDAGAPRAAVPEPAQIPVAYLSIASDTHPALDVGEIAERFVLQPLATVAGIAELRTHGLRKSILLIRLDGPRLPAYGVSRAEVEAALRQLGYTPETIGPDEIGAIPAGAVPLDPEALSNLVLKASGGAVIRLRDVATVERGMRPSDVVARFNGRPAVIVEIFLIPRIQLAEGTRHMRDALPPLLRNLPAGMDVTLVYACAPCAEPSRR